MAKENKACRILSLIIAIGLLAVTVVSVALLAGFLSTRSNSASTSYKLHVNPADPVILSAETPEGDVIYMLGNKTADGVPQSIEEFQVEGEDGSTFVSMNGDGTIGSAQDSDGLQIELFWDDNLTTVHVSIILSNGSQQLTINVNLSEPVGENFTDFSEQSDIDSGFQAKRSAPNINDIRYSPSNAQKQSIGRFKRQSAAQTFASVFVSAESCNEPDPNARVFADVLLDYNEDNGNYESSAKYWGTKTPSSGKYEVRIPTASASMFGEKTAKLCDKIEMILGKICDFYSTANDFTQLVSKHDADSVFCFFLGNGLRLAFPLLRIFRVYRFCKTIFKPLKAYCNTANKDLPLADISPIELLCDGLPLVDNGIDFLQQKDVLFTPTAIFPGGNLVMGQGKVFTIQPGSNNVPTMFTVNNDQAQLKITHFSVTPFDPAPGQNYVVSVSYNCYSSSLVVSMSIVGTDNYTGFNRCYTGPQCVLFVPGAAALVQDAIEVFIQDSSSSIHRNVIIIF